MLREAASRGELSEAEITVFRHKDRPLAGKYLFFFFLSLFLSEVTVLSLDSHRV